MSECRDLRRTVPLYRVVSAAIADTHEDINKVQQLYAHWAARGLRKLTRETLKSNRKSVMLEVNASTNTATLPVDFEEESFVGVIIKGEKHQLRMRTSLIDTKNLEMLACVDKCSKCNQSKKICEDLNITEETVLVEIGDTIAEQTVIKKLYPNGDYYLETRIPLFDIESSSIVYTTSKQFITSLDLKPCGCLDDSEANKDKIKCCAYDVWCNYYTECSCDGTTGYGGYIIFEETGLIQFDKATSLENVYLEYYGFLLKKNGQYHVPEVAFETLVEYIKYKSIQNRRNIPDVTISRWFESYTRERSNMKKVMSRVSLSNIMAAILMLPKFDYDYDASAGYVYKLKDVTPKAKVDDSCGTTIDSTTGASTSPAVQTIIPLQIAVIAGVGSGPTPATNTYQANLLINALTLNVIIVNNTPETIQANQFTFDSVTGTITRYQGDGVTPNNWNSGDVLIINFSKYA